MKICHITSVHARDDIRIFWKEAVSAAEAGMDVSILVNDDSKDEMNSGVKIYSIRKPVKNRLARILSFSTKTKLFNLALTINADIYQFHDPELLGVGLKLQNKGFDVVYDVHEDVPRQILAKHWIPKFIRPLISQIFESYENFCSRQYSAIIVPTPHIQDRFTKINKTVSMICNFPSTKDIYFSKEKYSNKNPTCYVGGLTETRGIRQIAEASKIARTTLNLCGSFSQQGLEKDLKEQYTHINFHGFLGRDQINEILHNSSLGFVTLLNTPNDANAYPIKMFEYMAAGIPVIASDFPVYRKIIDEADCGICVNPLDVQEIAIAIKRITTDADYAKKLGHNGYQAVVKHYSWDQEAKEMIKCYHRLKEESRKTKTQSF